MVQVITLGVLCAVLQRVEHLKHLVPVSEANLQLTLCAPCMPLRGKIVHTMLQQTLATYVRVAWSDHPIVDPYSPPTSLMLPGSQLTSGSVAVCLTC